MMNERYVIHTTESAPEGSRPALETTRKQLHMIPNLMGVMAGSPQLVNAFQDLTRISSTLTLAPLERETVELAVGVEVGCTHCIAFHTMALQRLRAPETLIRALKSNGPIEDHRLAVLRDFARAVITGRGSVEADLHERFFDAGFTAQQALEIVFLVGMLTLSMYTSRLAGVPLDGAFEALAS